MQRCPCPARATYTFSRAVKTPAQSVFWYTRACGHTQKTLAGFPPPYMKRDPKPLACTQRPSHTHREKCKYLAGSTEVSMQATSHRHQESMTKTRHPALLLGHPPVRTCTHPTPGASHPACYISTDDHTSTQGASLTPDIPPAHPSFLATASGGCNLLAAAPHPIPKPRHPKSPKHSEEPSLIPVPGCSKGSEIAKNKWHRSLCNTNISLPGD